MNPSLPPLPLPRKDGKPPKNRSPSLAAIQSLRRWSLILDRLWRSYGSQRWHARLLTLIRCWLDGRGVSFTLASPITTSFFLSSSQSTMPFFFFPFFFHILIRSFLYTYATISRIPFLLPTSKTAVYSLTQTISSHVLSKHVTQVPKRSGHYSETEKDERAKGEAPSKGMLSLRSLLFSVAHLANNTQSISATAICLHLSILDHRYRRRTPV